MIVRPVGRWGRPSAAAVLAIARLMCTGGFHPNASVAATALRDSTESSKPDTTVARPSGGDPRAYKEPSVAPPFSVLTR